MTRVISRIRSESSPIRFVISRVLWHTKLSSLFTIRRKRYILNFYPTSLSASLWLYPEDREFDEQVLDYLLCAGETYVDVGANVGTLVLAAANKVGPTGKVIAFEPSKRIYQYLGGNIRRNGYTNIETHNLALGNDEIICNLDEKRSDDQSSISFTAGNHKIKLSKLDTMLRDCGGISVLKIDVEGFELNVLKGGQNILSSVKVLLLEINPRGCERYGYEVSDLIGFVHDLDFQPYNVSSSNFTKLDRDFRPRSTQDIVAFRDAKVAEDFKQRLLGEIN